MSYRVYPVTRTELDCKDYRVKINGEEIALNSARVSAEPFNRYWPGHQRQIEQTELINFASFAICKGDIVVMLGDERALKKVQKL